MGFTKKLTMLLLFSLIVVSAAPMAWAERGSVVIDGPGFKMEKKKGWFGRSEDSYKDVLGNTVVHKKGWFGRKSTEQSIMGSRTVTNGNNISVYGPDGKPVVVQKKSWLNGTQTHIDGNGIWNNMREMFKDSP